jgi:hypothetical protein
VKGKENVEVQMVNIFTWRKAKKLLREHRPRIRQAEGQECPYLSYIATV